MSVSTFVFLRDDRLPTPEQLQCGLDHENIGIVLDHVDDLRRHTGYLPAKYKGHDSGFEWYYGPTPETFGEKPEQVGDRNHAINFVTFSDMRELVCALLVGATIARISDGIVYDEESESYVDGKQALEIAKRVEAIEL